MMEWVLDGIGDESGRRRRYDWVFRDVG